MPDSSELLRRGIAALGFDEVRFASAAEPPDSDLRSWLSEGFHADMHWMERSADKRLRPEQVLPGVRSIILLGVNYATEAEEANRGAAVPASDAARLGWNARAPGSPIWARYALTDDYHDRIAPALVQACKLLEEICGLTAADYRYYVDTGPVLERGWSARSGMGFVGKNAMLISRSHGNWLFLSAILTRAEIPPDPPIRRGGGSRPPVGLLCGTCTRCLDACPTAAFPRPGVVDARRCIAYQTIENRGVIPRGLRPAIGLRVFGCDACLEVCPWNRFARRGRSVLLGARRPLRDLGLRQLLELTPAAFAEHFRGTPVKRLKLAGLLRNACVAAGNAGDPTLLPPLVRLASEAPPLVRAHAVWAAIRLGGRALLDGVRAAETDKAVLEEYEA